MFTIWFYYLRLGLHFLQIKTFLGVKLAERHSSLVFFGLHPSPFKLYLSKHPDFNLPKSPSQIAHVAMIENRENLNFDENDFSDCRWFFYNRSAHASKPSWRTLDGKNCLQSNNLIKLACLFKSEWNLPGISLE